MITALMVLAYLVGGGISLAVYRRCIADEFCGPDLVFIPVLWPLFLPVAVAYLVAMNAKHGEGES